MTIIARADCFSKLDLNAQEIVSL